MDSALELLDRTSWLEDLRRNLVTPEGALLLRNLDEVRPTLLAKIAAMIQSSPRRVIVTADRAKLAQHDPAVVHTMDIVVDVPALRDRPEDIPRLVQEILAERRVNQAATVRCSAAALGVLLRHAWPGNLSELRQTVATASINALHGDIGLHDLPQSCLSGADSPKSMLERAERGVIVAALRQNHWNKKAVAEELGIARATLYRKLRLLDIRGPSS
jgi:transcriptional regulator with AAA-type ATPase domain